MAITERGRIIATQAEDFNGDLRSDVIYIVPEIIDLRGFIIDVPVDGLTIFGYNFDTCKLICSEDQYTMFHSLAGGSGNLLLSNLSIEVTGSGSKVFDVFGATGNEALEITRVNYNNCVSLGEISDYRQLLEDGTGRFGGSPDLTFSGAWNGARITTSITRNVDDGTTIFKEGTGLTFSGRFITDMNCDLKATGAFFDFQDSNITNDESLLVQGAYITRNGVLNTSDTTLTPNINETSVKSNWAGNTGIGNTQKYIKGECTAEAVTTISAVDTYYPLNGTVTKTDAVQFDSPANGQYRLLTGNGRYQITGDITLASTANNQLDIRVTKSTDGGSTFPTQINHIGRQVNNLSGARDVAFMPINFIADLSKNDILRLEVENKTGTNDITQELGSYLIVTEV